MGKKSNLTGVRFGKLVAIEEMQERLCTHVVWKCVCDCGNITHATANALKMGRQISCGCVRKAKSIKNLSGDIADKVGQINGTNASEIRSNKPQINNASGFRGVSLQKPRGNRKGGWVANITFQGTQYFLGMFQSPEQASEAYQEAKKHIHCEFVKWYEENVRKFKRKPKPPYAADV